uniref:Gl15 n=1 Tax=Arundo donax TaxID=35708 RepID=A0A0A9CIB0_ARUDO
MLRRGSPAKASISSGSSSVRLVLCLPGAELNASSATVAGSVPLWPPAQPRVSSRSSSPSQGCSWSSLS